MDKVLYFCIFMSLALLVIGLRHMIEHRAKAPAWLGSGAAFACVAMALPLVPDLSVWGSLAALALILTGVALGLAMDRRLTLLPQARPRRWALLMFAAAALALFQCVLFFGEGDTASLLGRFGLLMAFVLSLDLLVYALWLLRSPDAEPVTAWPQAFFALVAAAFVLLFIWALLQGSVASLIFLAFATLGLALLFMRNLGQTHMLSVGLMMVMSFGGLSVGLGLYAAAIPPVFFGGVFAFASGGILHQHLQAQGRGWLDLLP